MLLHGDKVDVIPDAERRRGVTTPRSASGTSTSADRLVNGEPTVIALLIVVETGCGNVVVDSVSSTSSTSVANRSDDELVSRKDSCEGFCIWPSPKEPLMGSCLPVVSTFR